MTAMCDMILIFQFLLDFELLMMVENRRSFKCAKTKRESQNLATSSFWIVLKLSL